MRLLDINLSCYSGVTTLSIIIKCDNRHNDNAYWQSVVMLCDINAERHLGLVSLNSP